MDDFYVGEKKYVSARVQPKKHGEIAVITSAVYELLDGETVIESGNCTIDKDTVEILLATDTAGFYTLKIIFTVGVETIIGKTTVAVRE